MSEYTEIALRYAKEVSGEKLSGNDGTICADLERDRSVRIHDTHCRSIVIETEHFDGFLDALLEVKRQREARAK